MVELFHKFYFQTGWERIGAKPGKIKGAVISQTAGRWYVSIAVDVERPEPKPLPKPVVGIDLGIKTLLVLSDGRQYENQVLLRSELKHNVRPLRRQFWMKRERLSAHF